MKKDYKYNRGFEAMKNNVCDTSYGLCPAPMSAQGALDILTSYLLGDDYYVANSMSPAQMNAVITEQILDKYSKKWVKDWNHFENSRL
jgi:uncharacterized membrane protein